MKVGRLACISKSRCDDHFVTLDGMQVSKDIRKIRHFEETILLDYRLFLSQCDETIKGMYEEGSSLHLTVFLCVC